MNDVQGRDLVAQIRAELEQLMPLVSALTKLPTRWSGVVELVAGADFKGKKRFTCDIQLAADLAAQDIRWATLIHESLHCHSAGYNGTDYRLYRGWEEGVVEQLQRLLRQTLLSRLGITLSEQVFWEADSRHPFNDRIEALEAIRRCLSLPEVVFYGQLLGTPIAERFSATLRQIRGLSAPQQKDALQIFSASAAVLRKSPLL